MLRASEVPLDEGSLIDAAAVRLGADLGLLMEAAGAAVAERVEALWPTGALLIACGGGNNGGDGYVAARLLAERGRTVRVWPVSPARSELCRRAARRLPGSVDLGDPGTEAVAVVDAILGAGAHGPLRAHVQAALERLRSLGLPALAVDAPTGIGTDAALLCRETVTFGVAKQELRKHPDCGELVIADIGLPRAAIEEVPDEAFGRFPLLGASHHKGQHGQVLVVGGGAFPGALSLACQSALRSGCDLVRALTADGPALPDTIISERCPGPILRDVDGARAREVLARSDAMLIGPGLGQAAETAAAVDVLLQIAEQTDTPTVIDADGITLAQERIRSWAVDSPALVLTPHGGERRALLGARVDDSAIHAFARPNRVLVAKGPVDFISDGQQWQRNPRGNPRMTVGGSGDVLAGLTAGLLARGCRPFDAGRLALLWLTTCADQLWQGLGPCYDPLDLIGALPSALQAGLSPLGLWPPVTAPDGQP